MGGWFFAVVGSMKRFRIWLKFLIVQLCTGSMCIAATENRSAVIKDCFRALGRAGKLNRVQPFIPWEAVSVTPKDTLNWEGRFSGKIFIKTAFLNHKPDARFFDQVQFSRQLSDARVGPKFFGTTLDQRSYWGLIYAFVDGVSYRPNYDFSKDANYAKSWEVVRPNFAIPPNTRVTSQTINDVNRAFDTLNSFNIDGEDVEFLITRSGRAVLIDYGAFKRGRSAIHVRRHNDQLRLAVIEGLQANLPGF